jgi:t-SNARE complex subunit (syntaxin)
MYLDSIDQHIINTEVNVHGGNQHLTKAVTYQVAFIFI